LCPCVATGILMWTKNSHYSKKYAKQMILINKRILRSGATPWSAQARGPWGRRNQRPRHRPYRAERGSSWRLLRQRRQRRRVDGGGWGVRALLYPADRRLVEALREHHRCRLFSCGPCGDAEDQGSSARLMGFAIGDRPIEAGKLGDLGIGKGGRTNKYRGGSSRSRRRHRQRMGNLDVGHQRGDGAQGKGRRRRPPWGSAQIGEWAKRGHCY
jgi:hypothetical protein